MRQPTPYPPATGPPTDHPQLQALYQDSITRWIEGAIADSQERGIHGVSIILNIDDGYRHASAGISPARGRMMAALGRAGLAIVHTFYHKPPAGNC